MPETAQTLDRDALPWKDHIRAESQTRYRRNVLPEPEPTTMKFTPKLDLRSSVGGPVPLHDCPDVR
jgi:hypothetical protein